MLQELTNKIKKIIPEIEELEFGCKVQLKEDISNGKIKYYSIVKREHNSYQLYNSRKGSIFWKTEQNFYKIIGRPITLEDILRCLEKSLNSSYQIRDTGEILIMGIPSDIYWKLGKPLDEQSEETIKELNNLI